MLGATVRVSRVPINDEDHVAERHGRSTMLTWIHEDLLGGATIRVEIEGNAVLLDYWLAPNMLRVEDELTVFKRILKL
jgi:hypothetical protein